MGLMIMRSFLVPSPAIMLRQLWKKELRAGPLPKRNLVEC